MYYKEIVNAIITPLKHFKGVNFVRYTGDDLINQQHNHKALQAWVDNISFSQYNLTTNINKIEFQIYILGFPENTPENILDIQDECYNVAVNLLTYIDNMPQFQGMVSLYDWSILTLSNYTAQNNAGVKVSVVLNAMSPINMCEYQDWFNDKPYEEDEDKQITINEDEIGEITLKPVTLKPTNRC